MRYRIVSISFFNGDEKHFPQRLSLTGYKDLSAAGYKDYANAVEHIARRCSRKVTRRYFWSVKS